VRGLCGGREYGAGGAGSTPARAGIMLYQLIMTENEWEHPRACGDYEPMKPVMTTSSGAPPRVRGLFTVTTAFSKGERSTPARAGIIARKNARPAAV